MATRRCASKNQIQNAVRVLEQDTIVRIQDHVGRQDTGVVALGNIVLFMNILQITDLLSADQFQQVLIDKKSIINTGTGSLTLEKDGSITKDSRILNHLTEARLASDYVISKDSYFNLQHNVEGFEKLIGKTFTNILYAIQKVLINNDLKNPRPYNCRAYRHNKTIKWHKHAHKGIKARNFWLSIYYMHPNWDTKYGGKLNIGLTEKDTVQTFDCLSNSVVIHNGYYGHSVDELKLGYEGDRDIFLAHWMTD